MFTADEIDCLVRTAGEAVCGDIDNLSSAQVKVAEIAFTLLHAAEDQSSAATPPARAEQRLAALAEQLGLDMLDLYDVVHDLHSKPASQINNNGLGAQIRYLLDQLGETETEQVIREAAQPQHADQE